MKKERLQELAGMQLNEEVDPEFKKQAKEFRKIMDDNDVSKARKYVVKVGWNATVIKDQVQSWFVYGK